MSDDIQPMDVEKVIPLLQRALGQTWARVAACSAAAGALPGSDGLSFGDLCRSWAVAGLEDAELLAVKLWALDGDLPSEVAKVPVGKDVESLADALLAADREAMSTLHEIIPLTGEEDRSEALEHLTEHLMKSTQERVDRLLRLLGRRDES